MKPINFLSVVLALVLFTNSKSIAQQLTKMVVRAKAKDAKFIGSGMDGAKITIVETSTGDTLAKGITKGGTGDTRRLVKDPVKRYEKLSTPDAAKFEATLSLAKPTFVTISATANAGNNTAEVTSSTQKWLIPGKDINGDGVILEIPGFVITNKQPKTDHSYNVGDQIPIRSHIVMMCGCPTSDGGLWDSSEYDIKARISKGGKLLQTVPLAFTGQTSLFGKSFTPSKPGKYQIIVYAFHPKTGNIGVAKTRVRVEK